MEAEATTADVEAKAIAVVTDAEATAVRVQAKAAIAATNDDLEGGGRHRRHRYGRAQRHFRRKEGRGRCQVKLCGGEGARRHC